MQASRIGWGMLLFAIGACGDSAPGERVASPAPKVVTRTDPASTAECPYGGSIVSSGLDDNDSGALDDAEIRNRTMICTPSPGAPSPPILVRLRLEFKGAHCAIDGTAVDSGPDTNRNGMLDEAEVAHTDYVCGQALITRFRTELQGPHCVAGGLAFLLGLDRDGDGLLSNDEVLQIEYECSEILSRDVGIGSDADVAALAKIRVINGTVVVEATSLTDLVLPQLTRVIGDIFIGENPQLTRVSLPALQGVDGLGLRNDPALTAVEAPALLGVKQLEIAGTALPDLGGFPALRSAETGIILRSNPALQSLQLPSLSSIGGQLEVAINPTLTTLSLAVDGQLDTVLVVENGLQTLNLTLDSVRQLVGIGSNPQLATASVKAQQLGSIDIRGNASLSHLVLNTEESNGDVSITGNDSLRSFTFFNLFGTIHGSLTLSGPFDDTLSQATPAFDTDGDCTIQQTHLTRLSVFRVGGMLNLRDNAEFTGPISAHTLGGLLVTGSPAMDVLTLDTPQIELPRSVVVGGNHALREVDLGSITSIRDTLALLNSPALVTTPSSVTSIGANLFLQNDPALAHLGFDRLQHVGFLADIEGMDSLQAIELPALTQVQNIEVSGNGALRHLGLAALPGPANIFVSGNPHLPACEVDALFARIPGTHEQNDNDETAKCSSTPWN